MDVYYLKYLILFNLLAHRGYAPTTKPLSQHEFETMSNYTYIRGFSPYTKYEWNKNHITELYHQPVRPIESTGQKKRGIFIICINPSEKDNRSAITKLVKSAVSYMQQDMVEDETILVVADMQYTKETKDLTKLYRDKEIGRLYITCTQEIHIKAPRVAWNIVLYNQMTTDWPRTVFAMPHAVCEPNDENLRHINTYQLTYPTISYNDIGTIWIGANVGDIVRIDRSTIDIGYRRVILPITWHPEYNTD
jgi:DNA-directed RNA polymerase subunit H (RpoH/RPB5)